MSFMDKIKTIMSPADDEDYYDSMAEDIPMEQPKSEKKEVSYFSSDLGTDKQRNKVVNIHATTQLQVVLVKPERVADAPSIADHLNDKKTVVLNLESANKEVSRRLIDFLSGVAYANKGQIKRVANSTFIITPFNVDIMGDMLIDELENSGMYV